MNTVHPKLELYEKLMQVAKLAKEHVDANPNLADHVLPADYHLPSPTPPSSGKT